MEGRVERLREKLEQLLKEAAEVSAEIQKLDGTQAEVPHYSQIENAAHETGKELSRMIQQSRICEGALGNAPQAGCPTCGEVCEVAPPRRFIKYGGRMMTRKPGNGPGVAAWTRPFTSIPTKPSMMPTAT